MKFSAIVTVVGMKSSKGQMESGQTYDSTKAYVLMDMDTSKGKQRGQSAEDFTIGDSTEFDKFASVELPFQAEGAFELVTTGNSTRTLLHSLKPLGKPAKV